MLVDSMFIALCRSLDYSLELSAFITTTRADGVRGIFLRFAWLIGAPPQRSNPVLSQLLSVWCVNEIEKNQYSIVHYLPTANRRALFCPIASPG